MSVSVQVNPRLAALTQAGTSVWLDQIRRTLIEGGELQRLVDEDSLRGVTSNPSIFEKAILGSDDYDTELVEMAKEGLDAKAIYDRIAIRDVQLGADVLRPVWEKLDHADGFVSLEVSPDLARDTDATLEQARSYWQAVDRPNVMIKIPGTDEGRAGDRAGDQRGHQRQRHAAVRRRGLRQGGGGVHPRPGAPRRGGRGRGRPLGGVVLRLPRGLRGGQAPGGSGANRPAGHRGRGQRARRLRALPADLPRRAVRRSARGRGGGAAPAVGLHRGQEPALLGHAVRGRAGRSRHRQHDADAHAAGHRAPGRGPRRDRRPGPLRAA